MKATAPRVLLVEDHTDTEVAVRLMLEHLRLEVVTARGLAEGLSRILRERFDLYLFDRNYKDGEGLDLCRFVRQQGSQTPVLFFSDSAREQDRQELLAAGADRCLVKPQDLLDLPSEVLRLIERSRSPHMS